MRKAKPPRPQNLERQRTDRAPMWLPEPALDQIV